MKIKNIFLIILFIILLTLTNMDYEEKYYQINNLIELFDLTANYDQTLGKLVLIKNNKKVTLILDSPYIKLGDKNIFVKNYIKYENGIFLIPENKINLITDYLDINLETSKKQSIEEKNNKTVFLDIKREELNNLLNIKNDENIKKEEEVFNDKIKESEEVEVKNKYIFEKEPKEITINAIIIDPGHGGQDPGAIGYSGTKEKDIALKTSLILAEKLKKKYKNKRIILTRDKDIFPPLEKRAEIANYVFNKYGASIFISIHVNGSPSKKAYGFETWYLVEEYRRNIIKKGEISDDVDVEKVLNTMMNDEIYIESRDLANKIQNNLKNVINYISIDRGIKEETYFVIKKSIMPAVLVEIGFNTNKYEEIRLTKYSYLNKIAIGIFEGINEFINEYEKTDGYTR